MANKIVKYRLLDNGKIPPEISDGGYYPKNDVLIGATQENSSYTGEGEFVSQNAIIEYLDTYTPFYKPSPSEPYDVKVVETTTEIASYLWNKKT